MVRRLEYKSIQKSITKTAAAKFQVYLKTNKNNTETQKGKQKEIEKLKNQKCYQRNQKYHHGKKIKID